MYRLLALLLLVLIAALQYKLWHGEGSWTSEQALMRQVDDQKLENARLKQRNAALLAEVEDLKNGQTAVEERARSEMGMVKPGETFYRVVEPSDPNANPAPEDVPEDAGSSPASTASAASAGASFAGASPASMASPGAKPTRKHPVGKSPARAASPATTASPR
ncbi:MAG: cell division protein FtsB [Proteobacteria bacterium]|nr:cell division protein FtsB [Pseudomonadota bacterium]